MSGLHIPVIDIYPTVQGQGPRAGEPIILVRTGIPESIQYVWLTPTRVTPTRLLDVTEFGKEIESLAPTWVFFGGEDPLLLPGFNTLIQVIHSMGKKVWVDTTGLYPVPGETLDYISVGPKPNLPLNPQLLEEANDIRLYYDPVDSDIWVQCLTSVLRLVNPEIVPIYIAPRNLSQDCITATIRLVLTYNSPHIHFDLPAYRTLPSFDSDLNGGKTCSICNVLDGTCK